MKSSDVSIKTWSTPASLTIQGQVTKDTTVKWSIVKQNLNIYSVVLCRHFERLNSQIYQLEKYTGGGSSLCRR